MQPRRGPLDFTGLLKDHAQKIERSGLLPKNIKRTDGVFSTNDIKELPYNARVAAALYNTLTASAAVLASNTAVVLSFVATVFTSNSWLSIINDNLSLVDHTWAPLITDDETLQLSKDYLSLVQATLEHPDPPSQFPSSVRDKIKLDKITTLRNHLVSRIHAYENRDATLRHLKEQLDANNQFQSDHVSSANNTPVEETLNQMLVSIFTSKAEIDALDEKTHNADTAQKHKAQLDDYQTQLDAIIATFNHKNRPRIQQLKKALTDLDAKDCKIAPSIWLHEKSYADAKLGGVACTRCSEKSILRIDALEILKKSTTKTYLYENHLEACIESVRSALEEARMALTKKEAALAKAKAKATLPQAAPLIVIESKQESPPENQNKPKLAVESVHVDNELAFLDARTTLEDTLATCLKKTSRWDTWRGNENIFNTIATDATALLNKLQQGSDNDGHIAMLKKACKDNPDPAIKKLNADIDTYLAAKKAADHASPLILKANLRRALLACKNQTSIFGFLGFGQPYSAIEKHIDAMLNSLKHGHFSKQRLQTFSNKIEPHIKNHFTKPLIENLALCMFEYHSAALDVQPKTKQHIPAMLPTNKSKKENAARAASDSSARTVVLPAMRRYGFPPRSSQSISTNPTPSNKKRSQKRPL